MFAGSSPDSMMEETKAANPGADHGAVRAEGAQLAPPVPPDQEAAGRHGEQLHSGEQHHAQRQ